MSAPCLISFEGIDGCGKSTQAKRLAAWLNAQGAPTVLTREPGGSDGAEAIRALLVSGEVNRWSAETEALLFTAARRDHLERRINTALAEGQHVVTDRFADSTRVYQGVARGPASRAMVDQLHALMIGREPDVTFVIDLDPEDALPRTLARSGPEEARFERMGLAFQQRLAAGFRTLAAEFPERIRCIDGKGSVDAVAARVQAAFREARP